MGVGKPRTGIVRRVKIQVITEASNFLESREPRTGNVSKVQIQLTMEALLCRGLWPRWSSRRGLYGHICIAVRRSCGCLIVHGLCGPLLIVTQVLGCIGTVSRTDALEHVVIIVALCKPRGCLVVHMLWTPVDRHTGAWARCCCCCAQTV